ncbi:hypothetical protein UES1_064 [Escherichia phage UE-S1]|nr:hypothetical protein UES1_064 [Escherichia phage UE-S1]
MSEDSKEYILRCSCGDKMEHCVHIAQFDLTEEYGDDKLGQCLISMRLNPFLKWYKRVWVAVKYIFGVNDYQYVEATIDVDILKDVVIQLEDTRSDEVKKEEREKRTDVKVL